MCIGGSFDCVISFSRAWILHVYDVDSYIRKLWRNTHVRRILEHNIVCITNHFCILFDTGCNPTRKFLLLVAEAHLFDLFDWLDCSIYVVTLDFSTTLILDISIRLSGDETLPF